MITPCFKDYNYRFDNKEEFQKWYEYHCEMCWDAGCGNCDRCHENKAKILKAYDESEREIQ